MALPPYIPGAALAIIGISGVIMTAIEGFDPTAAAHYTDSQIVRIYAALATLAIGYLLRWIGYNMLSVIRDNTEALRSNTAASNEQIAYYKSMAQRAVDATMNHHQ